jgi:uncharacterized membrane protein YhaH (DUF805 family)
MAGSPAGGFTFLFRTDKGAIDRATWWRGTVPLAGIALVATVLWGLVRPYLENGLERPPLVVLGAYLYLLVFSFGTLLVLVCEYNLSAKRFAARGLPRALAAVLPLSLLAGGAFAWYLPRSEGAVPPWSAWLVGAVVLGVVAWNIVELGVRTRR